MFQGCTSLVTLPSALATPHPQYSNQSYRNMFEGCTAITAIPSGMLDFEHLTPSSCVEMFSGCTGLKTVPSINVSGTVSGSACVNMFKNCTALTSVTAINAKDVLVSGFNSMFYNCSSLVIPPSLDQITGFSNNCM